MAKLKSKPKPLVHKTRLANGLTVLLREMHTAPVVSFWVWYRVGSRNERTGRTGASHWVEHMLFKGTARFPADALERSVSRTGGVWNAMTSQDWTTYYETMPSSDIDLALRLEADRMRNSSFKPADVDSERTVIISERQGAENSPMFLLGEELQAAAFRVHPYHHEVLGDQTDIESMQRADLYEHYREHYVPSNAIVVAVGDFRATQMLARIRELFGKIPAGNAPRPFARAEPEQRGERRVHLSGDGQTAFLEVAYHIPGARDPDFLPLVMLDSILAGGNSLNVFGGGLSNKTSRLYRALVLTELAVNVSGGISATIDPYLYGISCVVRDGRTPEEVEAALDAELDRIVAEAPTATELAKAAKQAKAVFAYSAESVSNLGFWYGFAEILDDHTWFANYLPRLMAVTAQDVHRVAKRYLARTNRIVGNYRPAASGPAAASK